jgi:serine/alanine adding enzyme
MKSFTMVDTLDCEQWNEFVCHHPKGSIFHTPLMFDVFAKTRNYSPLLLAATSPRGEILALLLAVRIQTLPDPFGHVASRSILYAEPLCHETPTGNEALSAIVAEHDARIGKQVVFAEIRPLYPPGVEKPVLKRSGYEYQEYLNYLIHLRREKDDLWKSLTPDCRRRIKNNLKKGLYVQDMKTEEGVPLLYSFLRLTYQRARVPLADKSLFEHAWRVFRSNDLIRISVAYHEGAPVGASVALSYRDRVFSWYQGADRLSSLNPMEALNWHEIEWGHEHGFALYDFGGAGWPNKPYGVRDFKAKFGGDLVQYGRYRKVYSPWKLALAERAYGLLRQKSNPTHWSGTGSEAETQG